MKKTHTSQNATKNSSLGLATTLTLILVFVFFLVSGLLSYSNTRTLNEDGKNISYAHGVISSLDNLISLLKDAETGQRGYLLTNESQYLEPYEIAVAQIQEKTLKLEQSLGAINEDAPAINNLKNKIQSRLVVLQDTLDIAEQQGLAAAITVLKTDQGKAIMDEIRDQVAEFQQTQHDLYNQRILKMHSAYRIAVISGLITTVFGLFLTGFVTLILRQNALSRAREAWKQKGQVGLSSCIVGELTIDQLGENALKFLAEYTGAQAGAFYAREAGIFKQAYTYGIPDKTAIPQQFQSGEGLLGQAVKDNQPYYLNNVPDGYIKIGSALGESSPRYLIIFPFSVDGIVNAVIELGFLNPPEKIILDMLEEVAMSMATSVRTANYLVKQQGLLEETQRQSEELQAQSEELRVSNEELEEQSRSLKDTQTRLELQQAELEQTNTQLEEQTQILESQRDELVRAKAAMQLKAEELEEASQYKSDFLANMSHELRTPLNSLLILSQLLADNPDENLSEEQVKFARTINSSGKDLLVLINDILDLSKIEAGHMEINAETVPVKRLINDLMQVFDPLAKQKGLELNVEIAEDCPDIVETDRQRLEQVLKNLLSNALKFTEKGSVKLILDKKSHNRIAFSIKDTGIGIAKNKQEAIFEAFQQADGKISRKYGGTGLGLSISRQLARLLGGEIELKSQENKGSTFTIIIPTVYDSEKVIELKKNASPAAKSYTEDLTYVTEKKSEENSKSVIQRPYSMDDDREVLSGDKRIILVVEDDEAFARILYDLTHELGFQCLVTSTAEDALIAAKQYLPSAIILDVGLPDNSGLTVLDRLKRDMRTRHIPIHVVSANDHMQTALSLGAAGYMLKPVQRDDLANALKSLETKLIHKLRRVLIVEDDLVQRESMTKLLGTHDVEIVGVGTAGECLERLKNETFDCMVLDLSLPDSSGYSLLETLSQEDAYSFPPVIVYTGKDLTNQDEQQLRQYSKSIIIKGAKSPERLVDEVTLFLHQVVSDLPSEQQRMLEKVKNRDSMLEGKRILVVEDDIRNVYSLTNILEPHGVHIEIARNGREALDILDQVQSGPEKIDLVLMDVMMPEMDGLTATKEIRKQKTMAKLPIIMLTAKAMQNDQEKCLQAGANDYMAKPLDVEKLLSLVRVWMPR